MRTKRFLIWGLLLLIAVHCQNDEPEASFAEEDVTFISADGFVLEGTLVIPENGNGEPVKGVVLVHGSGPNSRDERVSGQLGMGFGFTVNVFQEIAEGLAMEGFATLRYDKRTCFGGNGCNNDYPTPAVDVRYQDFIEDAAAAVDFLASREDIAPGIALAGHSQGGQVVPFVAESRDTVSDVILLAGPYRPIDALISYQADWMRYLCETLGYTKTKTDRICGELDNWNNQLAELRAGTFKGDTIGDTPVAFWSEWMQAGDDTPGIIADLDTRILVLQGDYDWNVPVSEALLFSDDLDPLPNATVTIVEELTHPFVRITQPDWTQIAPEDIVQSVDETAIQIISDWLGSD